VEDPYRKVPDLYFKVVDPKLQVVHLKAEVGELRSGGIPQFNPWIYRNDILDEVAEQHGFAAAHASQLNVI